MTTGISNMSDRIDNAKTNFVEMLMNMHGITQEQAEHVLAVFIKHKAVKRDIVNGRYNVTHGAYLEAHVITNALNM